MAGLISVRDFASSANGDNINMLKSEVKSECDEDDGDDSADLEQMSLLGLPAQFETPADARLTATARRRTFHCDLCKLELNSAETLRSHLAGMKHMKKMRSGAESGTFVQEMAAAAPRRAPVRLAEKLREAAGAVVGLAFVGETLACSNPDVEPFYECYLCGSQGEANGMFNHVFGRGHREKYLHRVHEGNSAKLGALKNAAYFQAEVDRLRENGRLDATDTVYSDELYPWPAGKAPWSLEAGGTGVKPTCVEDTRRRRRQRVLHGRGLDRGLDVDPEEVGRVDSTDQLDHYYRLAMALLEKAVDFQRERAEDVNEVETLYKMTVCDIVAMRNGIGGDEDEGATPSKRSRGASPQPGPSYRLEA